MSRETVLESNAHTLLVGRYSVWEATLCQYLSTLVRQRTLFYRVFFGGLVASALGFLYGVWFGVGSLVTGIVWCGTGLYLIMMQEHHYREELSRTRAQLERLAEERG